MRVADTLEGLGAHCSLVPVDVLNVTEPVASNQYPVAVVVKSGSVSGTKFSSGGGRSKMHRIFEKVFSSERGKSIGAIIDDELLGDPLGKYSKKAKEMVECALGTPLEIQGSSFSLQEVERKNLFAEMEFLFTLDPSLDLMKGSIDLLFFHRGKYYFVDWKTHWLGDSLEFYQTSHLQKAMEEHHYFLQAAIYKQAAMRLVEKMKSPVSFGGAFYIFLRGLTPEKKKNQGVFAFFPEHLNRDSSLCLQPLLV